MADNTNDKDFMLSDDMILDDIEDMPSFAAWPSGMYHVIANDGFVPDEVNDAPVFRLPLTLLKVMGLVDEGGEEAPPAEGSELGLMFQRNNKFGAANYKTYANPIGKKLGLKTVSEINEQSKGVEMQILLNKIQSKKDKTKWFNRTVEVIIL